MFGAAGLLCGLVLAGALLLWMYRSHRYLGVCGVQGLSFSSAAAIYWWLVPFANLVMPFLVMREIWRASGQRAGASNPKAWQRARTSPLLACWWGAWIGASIVRGLAVASLVVMLPPGRTPDIRDDRTYNAIFTATMIEFAGCALAGTAAVFAILLIRDAVERQRKLVRQRS